jgi:hypothetical protein
MPRWFWWVIASASAAAMFLGVLHDGYLFKLVTTGIGIWGINNPVGWGFDIINFVWWIGIGHAGTLISAILFLFRQDWRTSINRFAEAMTSSRSCARAVPAPAHRPSLAGLLAPSLPKLMAHLAAVPQPAALGRVRGLDLLHRLAALLVHRPHPRPSPPCATAPRPASRSIYGIFALGWRGSAKHWPLRDGLHPAGGLSTPLVVSVHTIVSFDFAVSVLPGWHTTIFPPYFVAGAIYSGFAMVLTIMIPVRMVSS